VNRNAIFLFGSALWLSAVFPFPVKASDVSLEQQVKEVASRLEGVMDTSAQAATHPKASNVRMTTCRVSVTGDESTTGNATIFLYQEQALSDNLVKPYRQRFLQLSASPYSRSVRSQSFKPTNPSAWTGFCNRPDVDRVLKLTDLGRPVCNVFLRPSGENYVGNTPANGCPANVRGAVRITNHIELYKTGMDTWDRGFDANGKQVWGAKAESYQFRRTSEPNTKDR